MSPLFRIPFTLAPQPEGGYTVTSPELPGLVTEGDSVAEVLSNVEDALLATIELYEDTGKTYPALIRLP
jgi:antitoxin HicB